jgi:hypothetical protein
MNKEGRREEKESDFFVCVSRRHPLHFHPVYHWDITSCLSLVSRASHSFVANFEGVVVCCFYVWPSRLYPYNIIVYYTTLVLASFSDTATDYRYEYVSIKARVGTGWYFWWKEGLITWKKAYLGSYPYNQCYWILRKNSSTSSSLFAWLGNSSLLEVSKLNLEFGASDESRNCKVHTFGGL